MQYRKRRRSKSRGRGINRTVAKSAPTITGYATAMTLHGCPLLTDCGSGWYGWPTAPYRFRLARRARSTFLTLPQTRLKVCRLAILGQDPPFLLSICSQSSSCRPEVLIPAAAGLVHGGDTYIGAPQSKPGIAATPRPSRFSQDLCGTHV